MNFVVDGIVLLLLLWCIASGWSKGILAIIIGPFSIFLSIVLCILYFRYTQNLVYCASVLVFGPVILTIIFTIILSIRQKTSPENKSKQIPSRIAGSVINVLWGSSIVAMFLIFLAIMPVNILNMHLLREGVLNSYSYKFVQNNAQDNLPYINSIKGLLVTSQDPRKMARLQSTEAFNDLYKNEEMQKILADPVLTEQIKNKNFSYLLNDPKIQAMFKDKNLLKKIENLGKQADFISNDDFSSPEISEPQDNSTSEQ